MGAGSVLREQRLGLCWCDEEGNGIATPAEAPERARRDAISQLLAMGLSPEGVAAVLSLSVEEVEGEQSSKLLFRR